MHNCTFITGSGYSGTGLILDILRFSNKNVIPFRPFTHHFFTPFIGKKSFAVLPFYYHYLDTTNTDNDLSHLNKLLHYLTMAKNSYFLHFFDNFSIDNIRHRLSLKSKSLNPEVKSSFQNKYDIQYDIDYVRKLLLLSDQSEFTHTIKDYANSKITSIRSIHNFDDDQLFIDKSFPYADYNQAINLLDSNPNFSVIFVFRNPIDQILNEYLYRQSLSLRNKGSIGMKLDDKLNDLLFKFHTMSKIYQMYPNRVSFVSFDDVLLDPHYRDCFFSKFNTSLDKNLHSKLNFERSIKNIGLSDFDRRTSDYIENSELYSQYLMFLSTHE